MVNNINIISSKENEIEFDVEIDGLAASDTKVCFVIETDLVDFSFKCRNLSGTQWGVMIPPLPNMEITSYPFHISVVIDGYYFSPLNGTITVVKSSEIYVKDLNNITFKPMTPNDNDDVMRVKLDVPEYPQENLDVDSKIKNILSENKNTSIDHVDKKVKIHSEKEIDATIEANKILAEHKTTPVLKIKNDADGKVKNILETMKSGKDKEITTTGVNTLIKKKKIKII